MKYDFELSILKNRVDFEKTAQFVSSLFGKGVVGMMEGGGVEVISCFYGVSRRVARMYYPFVDKKSISKMRRCLGEERR